MYSSTWWVSCKLNHIKILLFKTAHMKILFLKNKRKTENRLRTPCTPEIILFCIFQVSYVSLEHPRVYKIGILEFSYPKQILCVTFSSLNLRCFFGKNIVRNNFSAKRGKKNSIFREDFLILGHFNCNYWKFLIFFK